MSQPVASTSSSVPGAGEERRPEAGPLPQKVGEFGYNSAIHGRPSGEMREVDLGAPISMPARHPADRDAVTASESSPTTNSPTTAANRPTEAPSPAASVKKRVLGNGVIGGISFGTLFRLFFIIAAIAGTGVAWYFTIQKFTQDAEEDAKAAAPPPEQESDQDIINPFPFQSIIFVHVAFTIIVIFEFLFLERGIFHARAERYIFVNGMSPRALTNASMGIAPWNRPPLPTYAAALAESGVGTGDVEDNMIAILPPPAYGNTRGSTLLLSSMLPASLVRTFSRASNRSDSPQERRRSQEAEMEEGRRSRPISYGASQEVDDAHRARELEDALSKLERNRSRPA